MNRSTAWRIIIAAILFGNLPAFSWQDPEDAVRSGLTITWQQDYLTIQGDFPGNEIKIHYLEAYCRPGSTNRDWSETVIGHQSQLIEASADKRRIVLRDQLKDGVIVRHEIVARDDEIEFQLTASNPTSTESLAHWAQPCIRVGDFTGCGSEDAHDRMPAYIHKCFLFIDGKRTYLPTEPWADRAKYVFGQVFAAPGVDRDDVNPRPLSRWVPSCGLCGCESADGQKIFAVAWEPYQEIFQGVIACLHNDFRIGGLQPGESKLIKGKIYIVDSDHDALLRRFETDFSKSQTKSR